MTGNLPKGSGLPAGLRDAAEAVLAYLSEVDQAPTAPVDAVIGFGVFDLRLPRFCADLARRGMARHVIFTGGIGAGTGSLGGPEANVWRGAVRDTHPELGDERFILENRSTNTAENILFTAEQLLRERPALAFGSGIRSALIVASPSRLRRVRLTMLKLQPAVSVTRLLPTVDFDAERSLYEHQGVPYLAHLIGEVDRLMTYPGRGWIAPEPVPAAILSAAAVLRDSEPSRA